MPFLAPGGGTNYAVASSYTSGMNGLAPGMDLQVATFLAASPAAPSSALYTFWGGSNDVSAGMNPVTAADNIANEIKAVAGAGGKEFLWLNLPPLGDVPAVNGNPVLSAVANQLSAAFDQEWSTDVSALDADGIDVIGVDVDGLISKILADPSAYGFTDVTDDCMTTAGCDPNTFLYWDDEHPTTYADSLLADLAYAELPASTTPSATPEPSSLILLGTTLLGAGILLRKRWIPQPARAV
jgi:phospholipase/lecithinase/hemolysin